MSCLCLLLIFLLNVVFTSLVFTLFVVFLECLFMFHCLVMCVVSGFFVSLSLSLLACQDLGSLRVLFRAPKQFPSEHGWCKANLLGTVND